MSRDTRKKQEHYLHRYEKVERELPGLKYNYYQCSICNKVEYSIPELQKLVDYSKDHQFLFLQDWVLILLYSQVDVPIVGITSFLKQLFLTLREFAPEHNIPTENPGFRAYNFGPYSERIEDVIIGLEEAELIKTAGMRRGAEGEYFVLTEKGKELAKRAFSKLTPEQQEQFKHQRLDWHELGTEGLLRYIYTHYPEMAENSLILDRVLHRRRLGKKV